MRPLLTTKEVEVCANVEFIQQLRERLSEAKSGIEDLQAVGAELQAARDCNLAFYAAHNAFAVNVG